MKKGAVVTADIANYTRLSPTEQKKLIKIILAEAKPNKLEFYRGDSFQVYLKRSRESLKLVAALRTAAKKINQESMMPLADVRASIGIGNVNGPIRTLKTATGGAFVLSGRGFDTLAGSSQKLIIQSDLEEINPTLRLIANFIDYLMDRLTSKQAEVVFELLNGQSQIEVAKILHRSQATISQHLQSAGWREIEKLLEEFDMLTSRL